MRRKTRERAPSGVVHLAFWGLLLAGPAIADEPQRQPEPQQKQLVVAVYEAPPWSMKQADGSWHGVTVDLWNALAADVGLAYRLEEVPVGQILDGVASGRFATSAGPWAATVERQQVMDFTHSYVTTGLSIAIRRTNDRDRWISLITALTTPTALKLYLGIALLTLVAGSVVWWLERRHNPHFPARPLPGVGAGFWWAGVTTAGVGYGDKVPITLWGRAVALFWMLVSLVMITALIGFVTARLAVAEIGEIHGIAGLRRGLTVGTVATSASADFLRREDIPHRIYASLPDALGALRTGEVRAVVYGNVILRYYAQRDPTQSLEIVPGVIEPQSYAFPLPDRSPLREPLNQAMRRAIASPGWRDLADRYLGSDTSR